MRFLPFDQIILNTSMDSVELTQKLGSKIGKPGALLNLAVNHNKPFVGSISKTGFNITRVINYANPAQTEIKGVIAPSVTGCKISVRFELNTLGIIFTSIMMMFALIAFPVVITIVVKGGDYLLLFIPIGLSLLVLLATVVPFKFEVRTAKKMLLKTTNGTIQN